jgi:2,3-bisphosphoglycerate-independent phosphoglycerate mutase
VKYVVCVIDGAADEPITELGGRTPLETAAMPALSALAAAAWIGVARTIPTGMAAGSDVGNMAILGYDPRRFHTGRAPIEAAARGIEIPADRVVFRCNLVSVAADGTMLDFTAGRPDQRIAAALIEELRCALPEELTFHLGLGYRHLMTAPATWAAAICTPPHDLLGTRIVPPRGPAAAMLCEAMAASRRVFAGLATAATQIWLWGQGQPTSLPNFEARYGVRSCMVSAVDVVRGLGHLAGMSVLDVPGATGWYDTAYEAKRDAALAALADGTELAVVHVEAADEAGHAGDLDAKLAALANWDARLLAGLVGKLADLGRWRLLVIPDHATPVRRRTHTVAPVPYLLYDSGEPRLGGRFAESAIGRTRPVAAYQLMSTLLADRG